MILSSFRGAARALPTGQRAASSRASTVTACAPSLPICKPASGHQRRPSSSKASCPPGDQSNGPRAPAEPLKGTTSETSTAKSAPPRTSNGRHGRGRKSKDLVWPTQPLTKGNNAFDTLPAVPNVDMTKESDFWVSSLFALHRPLALGTPIPPTTTQAKFDKLFEPSTAKAQPADVLSTLQSTISALEADQIRWNVVQESRSHNHASPEARHLDGRPDSNPGAVSVEEYVSLLRPYHKPAPPVPRSPQSLDTQVMKARRAAVTREIAARSSKRGEKQDYKATMILRQVEGQDYMMGELQSFEPIKRAMNPPRQGQQQSQDNQDKRRGMLSFGKRVRTRKIMDILVALHTGQRQFAVPARRRYVRMRERKREMGLPATGGVMYAISVKRQRKLKMKKHKYKKLMKRTRNLRRRLDK